MAALAIGDNCDGRDDESVEQNATQTTWRSCIMCQVRLVRGGGGAGKLTGPWPMLPACDWKNKATAAGLLAPGNGGATREASEISSAQHW